MDPFKLFVFQKPPVQQFVPLFVRVKEALRAVGGLEILPRLFRAGFISDAMVLEASDLQLVRCGLSLDQVVAFRSYLRPGEVSPSKLSLSKLREDHPPVYAPIRPTRRLMAQSLATSTLRSQALELLEKDVYAPSHSASVSAHWGTWQYAASLWDMPPLPVTIQLIQRVAASLKVAGYRSHRHYFSEARAQHLRFSQRPLGPVEEDAVTRYSRSITRWPALE